MLRLPTDMLYTSQKGHTTERGRSMVEMLGVLTVLACITLGGVAGYRFAKIRITTSRIFDHVGAAYTELMSSGAIGAQAAASPDIPADSPVSLTGTHQYPKSVIKVDFGDDVEACNQFTSQYGEDSRYYILNKCEKE